jgi:hypothetical protein
VNKVHASSGRSRLVVIFLLTVIVLAACGLWHWGTAWTVPAAVGIPVRYKFLGYWDGAGSPSGKLLRPIGIAVASNGLIHVADSGNHRIVMLSAKGEYVADWSIPDSNPKVFSPEQVAVSQDGESVYATDLSANRILILAVERQPAFQEDGTGKR